MVNLTPAVKFLELFFAIASYCVVFQTSFPMNTIQEHFCQLLEMVPTSKMLQVPSSIDALFEHFQQAQIN